MRNLALLGYTIPWSADTQPCAPHTENTSKRSASTNGIQASYMMRFNTRTKANTGLNMQDNDSTTALIRATDNGYADIADVLRAASASE